MFSPVSDQNSFHFSVTSNNDPYRGVKEEIFTKDEGRRKKKPQAFG